MYLEECTVFAEEQIYYAKCDRWVRLRRGGAGDE